MMKNKYLLSTIVRGIKPEEYELVKAAAEADQHTAIGVTHVIEKDGELIGYGSLGAIALGFVWFDTKKCKARDTLMAIQVFENTMRANNVQTAVVPVQETSPLFPYMKDLGYLDVGKVVMFAKNL